MSAADVTFAPTVQLDRTAAGMKVVSAVSKITVHYDAVPWIGIEGSERGMLALSDGTVVGPLALKDGKPILKQIALSKFATNKVIKGEQSFTGAEVFALFEALVQQDPLS